MSTKTMASARNIDKHKAAIYSAYMLLSCVFTAELNVIHSVYIIHIELTTVSFIMPVSAGLLFGYLLAQVKLLSEQLSKMAFTDTLTGTYNRLHFNHFLESEIDKAKRYNGKLSIIFFDVDHFKTINDTHGHIIGDKILQQLTEVVSMLNRSSDIFARYGGEEFIVLASSTDLEGAKEHANRLKQEIEQHRFKVGRVTCSFGISELDTENDTMSSLLERADKALYDAKKSGRNCVKVR